MRPETANALIEIAVARAKAIAANGLAHSSDRRSDVATFARVDGIDLPQSPTLRKITGDRLRMRLRLIMEKAMELLEGTFDVQGTDAALTIRSLLDNVISGAPFKNDMIAIADGSVDLDYVVEGLRLELGIDGDPLHAIVHGSNMEKLREPRRYRKSDRKLLKPAGWTPPDVAAELRRQGWQGEGT